MSPFNLQRFPAQLQTERLLIRSPLPGDGAEVNAAIRETFDQLHHWMDWAVSVPAVAETEERSRLAHSNFVSGVDFPLQVHLKDGGAFVARSGLHPVDWSVPKFEIGYWCRACFQGHGYMTEAVRAVTSAAFDVMGANRVEIRCDPNNGRSRRVAELAGYTLEAELENDRRAPDGSLRSTVIYSLIPRTYAALKAVQGLRAPDPGE